MVDNQPLDFVKKLQELRERKGDATPVVPQPPAVNEPQWKQTDLLPDLGGPQLTDADKEFDAFVDSITFPQAYNRWIGKMTAVESKADGNMIACPFPDHADPPPRYNAWFDQNGKFFCGKCQEGGDVHDLAAIHFGYPRPGYKSGEMFHKLREDMAASFGYRTKKVTGGTVSWIEPPPPAPQPPAVIVPEVPASPGLGDTPGLAVGSPDPTPVPEVDGASATVSHMYADDDEPELVIYPTINWKSIVPEDTFLYEYMKAACQDDSPEEYHFWHGLIGLGSVVGRNVTLDDTRPVYANLMVCLLGATGTGKSRSRGHLDICLREAAPYHEDGTRTTGVKLLPVPSSGEYLVSQFSYEGKDPSGGTRSLGYQPVSGIVDFDELSALLSRANRQGSTMKSTIMALGDARDEVKIGGLQRGDFIAKSPFCSITASTQPKAIRTLLNHTDTSSGFLNRWIFAGGKEKPPEALGGSHSSTVIDMTHATEELRKVRGWGAMERKITLEPDAYEAYVRFFNTHIEPTKRNDQTDLLKRIDLITKKLMLMLTINLRRETVPLQVVQAVVQLFDYVLECYGILNNNIGITVMQDVMNEIERHIRRHKAKTGRGATARDIARYTARKNYSLDQIKKALDVMSALDIIELEPKAAGPGRPSIRYQAVGE